MRLECPWCVCKKSQCFLGEFPHRQTLHPVSFYRIFVFFDFPQKTVHRNTGCSAFPEFQNSDFPKVRISENPKIRIFRFPDFRISEDPDFRKSENSDFPMSGSPDVELSEASDARHRRCPDPSKDQGYLGDCLLYTSPSPRDMRRSRMPSSA